MRSPSHQMIHDLPLVMADPIPDMPTIDLRREELVSQQSNTNICNVEQMILHAIFEGQLEQLKTLKIHLRDLNYLEEFSETAVDKFIFPLALAVTTGQNEIVKLLLQNEGIDVNYTTRDQELSALKLACNNGYYEIAEMLVLQGADVNQPSASGAVPLFYCFNRLEEEKNYFENKQLCFKLGELLIDNGADIDAIVNHDKGYTLLMLFCSVKEKLNTRDLRVNLDVIKFLLQNGASKDKVCKKNKTVADLCKHHVAKDQVLKMLHEVKHISFDIIAGGQTGGKQTVRECQLLWTAFFESKQTSLREALVAIFLKSNIILIMADLDFNELFPRSWKQDKLSKNYIKGQYSAAELDILRESIVKYGIEHNLSEEELLKLITDTNKTSQPKVWAEIAKALPQRTVLSVYNQVKQKFNPENYGGQWSYEEEELLKNLVLQYGRKFKEISKQLNRTALNIKDKLRSMGDQHLEIRTSSWRVDDMVNFLRLLSKFKNCKFIKENWEEILEQELGTDWWSVNLQSRLLKRRRKQMAYTEEMPDEFIISKVLRIVDPKIFNTLDQTNIPWTHIADKMKSKSRDDIRNLWNQQADYWKLLLKGTVDEDQLIKDIALQDPVNDQDIDYDQVLKNHNITKSQKQQAWNNLKKKVEMRDSMQLQDIVELLYKEYRMRRKLRKQEPKEEEEQVETVGPTGMASRPGVGKGQLSMLLQQYKQQSLHSN